MPKKGVDSKAFTGLTITSVKFGNQCKYVGDEAFQDCIYLKEINDNNAIEDIGKNAFESTNLNSVKFDKLNVVYDEAFKSCSNLTSVNMPKCTDIKGGTFQDCTSLEEIEIPNVTLIGASAFEGCVALKTVAFPASLYTISYLSFIACMSFLILASFASSSGAFVTTVITNALASSSIIIITITNATSDIPFFTSFLLFLLIYSFTLFISILFSKASSSVNEST